MKAGGINPILAAKYDASTPAGATAQYGNVGLAAAQGASALGGTAVGIAKAGAEIANITARTGLSQQQTRALSAIASISETGSQVFEGLIQVLGEQRHNIEDFFTSLPDQIRAEVRDLYNEIKAGITSGVENVTDNMNMLIESIKSKIAAGLEFDLRGFLNTIGNTEIQ